MIDDVLAGNGSSQGTMEERATRQDPSCPSRYFSLPFLQTSTQVEASIVWLIISTLVWCQKEASLKMWKLIPGQWLMALILLLWFQNVSIVFKHWHNPDDYKKHQLCKMHLAWGSRWMEYCWIVLGNTFLSSCNPVHRSTKFVTLPTVVHLSTYHEAALLKGAFMETTYFKISCQLGDFNKVNGGCFPVCFSSWGIYQVWWPAKLKLGFNWCLYKCSYFLLLTIFCVLSSSIVIGNCVSLNVDWKCCLGRQ